MFQRILSKTAVLAAAFALTATPFHAYGHPFSQLTKKLLEFGGIFYVTQVESGVNLTRRLIGHPIRNQDDYLRLLRVADSWSLAPETAREATLVTHDIGILHTRAVEIMKKAKTFGRHTMLEYYELASQRAGFRLERLARGEQFRYFPLKIRESALIEAKKSLLHARRLVTDAEAAELFKQLRNSPIHLTRETSIFDLRHSPTLKREIFRGSVRFEDRYVEIEAGVLFKNVEMDRLKRPLWKLDHASPIQIRSSSWQRDTIVELDFVNFRGRPGATKEEHFLDHYFVARFTETEAPMQIVIKLTAKRHLVADTPPVWDYSPDESFVMGAQVLRTRMR